jgi:hypothetical protein
VCGISIILVTSLNFPVNAMNIDLKLIGDPTAWFRVMNPYIKVWIGCVYPEKNDYDVKDSEWNKSDCKTF